MNPVGQIIARLENNAIQQKRIEQRAMTLGQPRIKRGKRPAPIAALEQAARLHPGQQNARPALGEPSQNPVQIVLHLLWGAPAQHVVAPQRDQRGVERPGLRQRPLQLADPIAAHRPGDAGIVQPHPPAPPAQGRLQLRTQTLAGRKPMSGAQTVAQNQKR